MNILVGGGDALADTRNPIRWKHAKSCALVSMPMDVVLSSGTAPERQRRGDPGEWVVLQPHYPRLSAV